MFRNAGSHAHSPHRTDDVAVGIVTFSLAALPVVAWKAIRAERARSNRTVRSFLRAGKTSAL